MAVPDDAKALVVVYAPYVLHTAVTYEYEVPTVEEFRRRIEHTLENYPYVVAEVDGEIAGYAYTGRLGGTRRFCLGSGDIHIPAGGLSWPGHRDYAV